MFKNFIYDIFVTPITYKLLSQVLGRIPKNSSVLDIGIGNGKAVVKNAHIIEENNIIYTGIGIDIYSKCIENCKKNIERHNLTDNITIINDDVFNLKECYDYIIFSDSYAVIPEVNKMVEFCEKNLLNENGMMVIITTLFDEYKKYKSFIKRNLVHVTGIEFGDTILKQDLFDYLEDRNPEIRVIGKKFFPFFGKVKMYSLCWGLGGLKCMYDLPVLV